MSKHRVYLKSNHVTNILPKNVVNRGISRKHNIVIHYNDKYPEFFLLLWITHMSTLHMMVPIYLSAHFLLIILIVDSKS